jgi:hypothetical protein
MGRLPGTRIGGAILAESGPLSSDGGVKGQVIFRWYFGGILVLFCLLNMNPALTPTC